MPDIGFIILKSRAKSPTWCGSFLRLYQCQPCGLITREIKWLFSRLRRLFNPAPFHALTTGDSQRITTFDKRTKLSFKQRSLGSEAEVLNSA
nr:MAG TPA: hypothetical protein [Caudoviricetes sp.]